MRTRASLMHAAIVFNRIFCHSICLCHILNLNAHLATGWFVMPRLHMNWITGRVTIDSSNKTSIQCQNKSIFEAEHNYISNLQFSDRDWTWTKQNTNGNVFRMSSLKWIFIDFIWWNRCCFTKISNFFVTDHHAQSIFISSSISWAALKFSSCRLSWAIISLHLNTFLQRKFRRISRSDISCLIRFDFGLSILESSRTVWCSSCFLFTLSISLEISENGKIWKRRKMRKKRLKCKDIRANLPWTILWFVSIRFSARIKRIRALAGTYSWVLSIVSMFLRSFVRSFVTSNVLNCNCNCAHRMSYAPFYLHKNGENINIQIYKYLFIQCVMTSWVSSHHCKHFTFKWK